ncbi:GGDEF domain-containing protein [Blastococcus sp. CT_GayMR19]|uniref:GGDEF domain-containing protein n=1 Tax=Blastococcus sp. CT_GayMR19 TaxID=2559608 RepID=UPI0010748E34|nr:GGDEF domain-containing protein [Blastococcus sp. CT_GayMR19]TFV72928.1 GGDEF domain-containing protein [Blastococcus sp. CT_GayMR19]
MKRRGVTTQDRRAEREDRRNRGRSVAERALRQIRLVAVALLLLGGAGYRPTDGSELEREIVLPLAVAAATVLVLLAVLTGRAARAGQGRRSAFAAASTIGDAVIVLGVIAFAGLPPRSFALVLLMLPFLEAALWFGLSGLAGLWTMSSVALGALAVVFPDQAPDDALTVLVVAMPTLLLATIPVAMLAEHLVAQVGQLGTAREAADDRARLLGDLSAITADIFPLDVTAVVAQLAAGAAQLGATEVAVRDAAGTVHTVSDADEAATGDETLLDEGQETVLLTRDLDVPGGDAYAFTARVTGPEDEVARRVEALDLLVAQARVGLANAVLVQQLELLKQTYQDQATRDQLTGLLNRRGLVLTAEQIPGHLGVLFCDLDGFKGVNDTLGHAAGDELLEKVARRLESAMRADSVLGRMGGDEFVVVAPGASDEDLAGLGRRIEIEVGKPFLLEAGMARIGVSIGAAHAKPGERDLDSLLGQADQLMYEVKRSRKAGRATEDARTGAGGPA